MARIEYRLRIVRRDGSSEDTDQFELLGVDPALAESGALLQHVMNDKRRHSIEITPDYVQAGGVFVLAQDFARLEVVPVAIDQSMSLLLAERRAVLAAVAAGEDTVSLPALVHGMESDGSVVIAGYQLRRESGNAWRFVGP